MQRLDIMTNEMVKELKGQPFSFTVISSRSFSDPHFRYYFRLKSVQPELILDSRYPLLFLVCKADTCPSYSEMKGRDRVDVLCYDKLRKWNYPSIELNTFTLMSATDVFGGRIFTYKRI